MEFINKILRGDALSILRSLPDESMSCCVLVWQRSKYSSRTRIVQFFNLCPQRFSVINIFIRDTISLGSHQRTPSTPLRSYFHFSSSFVNRFTKLKKNFCLFFFNSQIRINCNYKFMCFQIRNLQCKKRFAIFCRGLFYSIIPSKVFKNQFDGLILNLFYSHSFIKYGFFRIFDDSYIVRRFLNCKKTIRIHNSCNISQILFSHKDSDGGEVYKNCGYFGVPQEVF